MSGQFSISIDISRSQNALGKLPESVSRNVERKMEIGAAEVAIAARENAPKFQSLLANSIREERAGDLHWVVSTHSSHALYVEEGTGPAAGRARYFPDVQSLYDVLKTSPDSRGFSWKRAGSKGRSDQEMELVFRAKAWAWHIYNYGTPAQPYMKPAAESKRSRLLSLINQGAIDGINEAFA